MKPPKEISKTDIHIQSISGFDWYQTINIPRSELYS